MKSACECISLHVHTSYTVQWATAGAAAHQQHSCHPVVFTLPPCSCYCFLVFLFLISGKPCSCNAGRGKVWKAATVLLLSVNQHICFNATAVFQLTILYQGLRGETPNCVVQVAVNILDWDRPDCTAELHYGRMSVFFCMYPLTCSRQQGKAVAALLGVYPPDDLTDPVGY